MFEKRDLFVVMTETEKALRAREEKEKRQKKKKSASRQDLIDTCGFLLWALANALEHPGILDKDDGAGYWVPSWTRDALIQLGVDPSEFDGIVNSKRLSKIS